jgi:hypothetical protein
MKPEAAALITNSGEHLQEFAKIHLANIVIWNLLKYMASEKIDSPRVYHLDLIK